MCTHPTGDRQFAFSRRGKKVVSCLVVHKKKILCREQRWTQSSQIKNRQTFTLFTPTVIEMHGQWLNNAGVGFPTVATQAESI
jgi:hypothetical protein